jgi:non-canonical purine NTP pyrophosphatase (RdgB/HAM1 family)
MITFVTGNDEKWRSAGALLGPFGVELVRSRMDLPEIQSLSVEEVAAAAAELACAKLGGPVMVTDAGYSFVGLGGFPGPFVKFVNQMLTAEDVVRLMAGVEDRRVEIREALAYCEPGGVVKVFTSVQKATVANVVGQGRTTMDRLMILDGFERVAGECDEGAVRAFWERHLHHYTDLGEWLVRR